MIWDEKEKRGVEDAAPYDKRKAMAKNRDYKPEDIQFPEQKIITNDLVKEMESSFIEYAMSVIVARALPDVRDGLKPVHRRILYAMYEDNLTSDKPFKKSATCVGDVLGRYHPHGDVSVYATPWTAALPASLFITNSQSPLKLMSLESVMPSNHLTLSRS